MKINACLKEISLSPIARISQEARKKALKYEEKTGEPFIFFQRGELDTSPFPEITETTVSSVRQAENTKYPVSGGSLDVKEALVKKLKISNNIEVSEKNVVVTCGGQDAINLVFELFRNQKAASFSPIWSAIVNNLAPYSNIEFKEVLLNEDGSINFDELKKTLKEVNLFYLNSPSNPTGRVFSREELLRIGELCKENEVAIISDEAYERIVYDGKHVSIASLPELKDYENIFTAFTFSKTFSMTGFRFGYLVTKNREVANLLENLQDTRTAGVPTFIQKTALTAYSCKPEIEDKINKRVEELKMRRDIMYEGLRKVKGLNFAKPEGAFYFFVNFKNFIPSNLKEKERSDYLFNLLLENGICVMPGNYFTKTNNFNDCVRLSFSATSQEEIKIAVERMQKLFNR